MRRAGFTLMELLIVIGIIMLLMGLLFPAFGMIKRQAMKAKCRTLIHQVDAACDLYRNSNGSYPDTPASWTSATTMATIFTNGGTPVVAKTVQSIPVSDWEQVATMLLTSLQTIDRDHFGTMGKLVDPWGQVLRYRPVQYYFYNNTGANHAIDKDPPPRPDSYQVWSVGVDEVDNFCDDNSDDIPNWK